MREWYHPLVVLIIFTNILKASCQEKGSLTFVIDNTYSMHDDIDQVKQSTDKITKIVFDEKASQIKDMVLVTFNDPNAKKVVQTDDRDEFKRYINNIQAEWGGDCAEPSMNGILLGLQYSQPGSFIYVFTDASAKDYSNATEIKNMCQKKQTQITFVLTGRCSNFANEGFEVYYDIATACSGIAFYVNKDEVNKVLTTIEETISGNKTTLTSFTAPPNRYTDITFIVDDETEYATVTAYGSNIYLSISGPTAEQERLLWLANAKVIKLHNPPPGRYVATVKGSTETSVYVSGRTDFLFTHGFSELEPKSLKDTTPQPIKNALTHLSISVTDRRHTVKIHSAMILNMDETVIKTLPLTPIGTDFYITPSFVAPSNMFKVAVLGTAVRNNKEIRRIAKIPVTPQEPPIVLPKSKKPVITITEGRSTQVPYGHTAKLTCKVSAYPEPKITWKNSRGITLASQSSVVEVPYEYISYLTIPYVTTPDTYTCQAANDQGTAHDKVELSVRQPFDVRSSIKGETEIQYAGKGTLNCDITASVPMHIYWTYQDKTGTIKKLASTNKYTISADGKTLTINKMDLDMDGKYTCKATLDREPSKLVEFSTQVKVGGLKAPHIHGKPSQVTTKGMNVAILCTVSGIPLPTVTWQFTPRGDTKSVSIPVSDNMFRISNPQEKDTGSYKCIAKNVEGSAEHITALTVQFPPTITSKPTTYKALVGDVALRIPCDTVGEPTPTITWTAAGAKIVSNSHYTIADRALIIKAPTKDDTKSYVCEAYNSLGAAKATFVVEVTEKLEDFGTVKETNVIYGTSKKLECGTDDPTQKVRWFKEGVELNETGKVINLENLDLFKEGNYTCHVSGMGGTYTLTYEVIVGFAPKFYFEQQDPVLDWDGTDNEYDMLDCLVEAKPVANVVWTYNGKVIEGKHSSLLPVSGNWGHYTCNASNVHGAVQRSFDVISSKCLIKRHPRNDLTMPLILTPESTWPVLDSSEDYLKVAPGQTVMISCPAHKGRKNSLEKFASVNEISASCDKQDMFKVNGKTYKVSDLHCFQQFDPIVDRKHVKCLSDTSELMRVGYDVHGFLESYEVCYDTSKHIPLYTRVLMSTTNQGRDVTQNWYQYPGIGAGKSNRGYTCATEASSCCYSKTQLVNARDVSDGAAQRSTYIDPLNAVLYWRPCDKVKDPWHSIETNISSQLSQYDQFVAWSGTHKLQEKNGQAIPRFLWKVLNFDKDESIAIVYINDPTPTKADFMCENICVDDNVPWMRVQDERVYCCEVDEFLQAFGLRGTSIGESMESAIEKIESKKYY